MGSTVLLEITFLNERESLSRKHIDLLEISEPSQNKVNNENIFQGHGWHMFKSSQFKADILNLYLT